MEPHARSAVRLNASSHAQGLEDMEISSLSGRGRKMSLTSALIEQAISLIVKQSTFSHDE